MRFRILCFLLVLVTIPSSFPPLIQPVRALQDDPVARQLAQMTIEEKIGQLFIVPFVGSDVSPTSDIVRLITEYKIGGVVLQASNSNFSNTPDTPRQVANLVNHLQTIALDGGGPPLLVAIDHEGDGWPYTRITGGVTPVPNSMAIGATWSTANAEAIGEIVGRELAAMGINLLFGPDVDVLNDPRPTGRGDIGTRVFGGDPFWVGEMGRAYVRGVHRGSEFRVATVAKHFPGHGGSDRLPDEEVATVDKSLQELRRIELAPFFALTRQIDDDGAAVTDAMMSSHIRYRGFQGDIRRFTAPISFDPEGMATLLGLSEFIPWRDGGGLIVSDALGVPAVRKHYDPQLRSFPHRRIAKEAFLAGNDLLVLAQFTGDPRSIWSDQFENIKDTVQFFRTEYRTNLAFAERVDESVARILRLKYGLYPNPTPGTITVNEETARAVAGQGLTVVERIARESLTLLYPTPEELRQRMPTPPRGTPGQQRLLIVTDTRQVRECYQEACQPFEPLPRDAIEKTILRLYGPGGSGQVDPEQITSITFADLKAALVESFGDRVAQGQAGTVPTDEIITQPPEVVADLIQSADWIIFAPLDLNTARFPNSDALKLFLAQGFSILFDKTIVVLAFNGPYYLDTTEVTKLTAYFGLYSKTAPHLEVAVRALFGEAAPQGASPVNVEGAGYDLVDLLQPDPDQALPVEIVDSRPSSLLPPVTVKVQAGPVLDRIGHPVPDGTTVGFRVVNEGEGLSQGILTTAQTGRGGMVEATLILPESGRVSIYAEAGEARSQAPAFITVASPPTPTPPPTGTPSPTSTPTVTPEPSATREATPAATLTPVPTATPTPEPEPQPEAPEPPAPAARQVGLIDFLVAFGATIVAGGLGILAVRPSRRPLAWRVRFGLLGLIGGMAGYIFYSAGWLRPETWPLLEPIQVSSRLMIGGLVFACAWLALGLGGITQRVRAARD